MDSTEPNLCFFLDHTIVQVTLVFIPVPVVAFKAYFTCFGWTQCARVVFCLCFTRFICTCLPVDI